AFFFPPVHAIHSHPRSLGLGYYIYQNRTMHYTDLVFAGLAAVIVIRLLLEHLVFDTLERLTVRRLGVQH
ncbi:hypothetical protein NX847_31275, partial [Burkholderia thailandensis]|nr:hypothetical protein [Burkholderia thailandensis]